MATGDLFDVQLNERNGTLYARIKKNCDCNECDERLEWLVKKLIEHDAVGEISLADNESTLYRYQIGVSYCTYEAKIECVKSIADLIRSVLCNE